MTGLIGAIVPAPLSLALKAGPYVAIGALALMAWHFDARAVANAALVQSQAIAFKQAQASATQIAQAALRHEQAAYTLKATEAQSAYQSQLADAQSAADRYIAAHRAPLGVQFQAVASGGSGAAATPASNSAGVPAGVPTDAVVVSSSDVQACTDVTTYAVNAHQWAVTVNP